MGLRPELKSDEKKVVPHLVIEISRCEYNIFFDFASLFRSMTPRPMDPIPVAATCVNE